MTAVRATMVVLLLLLAGCATGEVTPEGDELLGAAADATLAEGTAAFEARTSTEGGDDSIIGSMLGGTSTEGVVDFTTPAMQATTSVSGPLAMLTGGTDSEVRRIGEDVWHTVPSGFGEQGQDEEVRWVHQTRTGEHPAMPGLGQGGTGEPSADPADLLQRLTDLGVEVTEVGTEEVLGTDTTHLTATVPIAEMFTGLFEAHGEEALASVPEEERAQAEADAEEMLDAVTTGLAGVEVTVDAWVDGQGRMRRVQTVIPVGEMFSGMREAAVEAGLPTEFPTELPSELASELPGEFPTDFPTDFPSAPDLGPMFEGLMEHVDELVTTVTVDLVEFGVPVEVSPPPADQVVEAEELFGEFADGWSSEAEAFSTD